MSKTLKCILSEVGWLLLLLLTVFGIEYWVFDLSQMTLKIPFHYYIGADSYFFSGLLKGMMDHGWILENPSVGAPFGLQLYDYPRPENVMWLLLKGLTLIFDQYGEALNVYFLLTFFLAALVAFYVGRAVGLSKISSFLVAILFSFQPYHYFRGEQHLELTSYFLIPLTFLICFWLGREHFKKKLLWAIFFCFLLGISGAYYAFFSAIFILMAGLFLWAKDKSIKRFLMSLICFGTICAALFFSLLPNLNYARTHGRNADSTYRLAFEADVYGLRMAQMILPVSGHRVEKLQKFKNDYYYGLPLVSENDMASMGIIATIGFLSLILFSFFGKSLLRSDVLPLWASLNLGGFLIGTIGGVGALFSIFVSPLIRGYCRIGIFLAFLSLLTVGIILDELVQRINKRVLQHALMGLTVAVLLYLGILDQTPMNSVPPYELNAAEFENDRQFIEKVGAMAPVRGAIFQLPYMAYLNQIPIHQMNDYSHLKAYFHSKNLRWSYGMMQGRPGNQWYKDTANLPLEKMIATLKKNKFVGIYVDRAAYADKGEALIQSIAENQGSQAITSSNSRLSYIPFK